MGFIVWIVLVALVSVVVVGLGRFWKDSDYEGLAAFSKSSRTIALLVFLVVGGFSTLIASYNQVPAGQVGILYEFGAIVGQINEGPNFVAPWRGVSRANIQVQTHPFNKLAAFSSESQDVFVDATLNVKVSPKTVQELYRTVGPNWFEVLVNPRVAQNFKDETVKYKSVDIAPNRENIRHKVSERLAKELSPYSIEVIDLLLNNVDFKPEFKKAVEDKQIATQKALEEEQKVQVSRHVAAQAVETAKGEGRAALEKSTLLAEANRKLAASITPELVQYNLVDKLSANIEVMILPSGQNFILGSDMLKKGKGKEKIE